MKNWLVSYQYHFANNMIPRCSKKNLRCENNVSFINTFLKIVLLIVSWYLYKLIVLNYKFRIITVTHIPLRITSSLSFWHEIAIISQTKIPIVFSKHPGTSHYNSENSSSYVQMLHNNHLQVTELQFYINNITSCIGKVNIISTRIQYKHWNTIINCDNIHTSQLSINYNYIHQDSVLP